MLGYPDAPFDVVLFSPSGFILFILVWVLGMFDFILMIRTPALKFLFAKFLAVNVGENRILDFKRSKPKSSLIPVKNKGFFLGDPNHVFFEKISKVPMSIYYGSHALPVDLKMANTVDKMNAMGIKNNSDLNTLKDEIEQWNKEHPTQPKSFVINVLGESIPFDTIHSYFNRNDRADLIEAEVSRRTAVEASKRINPAGDIFKWIIGIGIVLLMVFVGYAIFSTAMGGGNKIDIAQLKDILGTARVISQTTNATGTGLK